MMHYFDSRDMDLALSHVMASGALPPAFPAVRIDGELYWDGGVLSNTPTERVFEDDPRRNALIFAVHLWHPTGEEPQTIWQVLNRHKDIQYSSRISNYIVRQREAHSLRHVIRELLKYVPEEAKKHPMVEELAAYSCRTTMHVVRLLAPRLGNESHIKDIDFSPAGIRERRVPRCGSLEALCLLCSSAITGGSSISQGLARDPASLRQEAELRKRDEVDHLAGTHFLNLLGDLDQAIRLAQRGNQPGAVTPELCDLQLPFVRPR